MSDSFFSRMLDRVTCGDCIDVMANMPARSVDFVLTDPPYPGPLPRPLRPPRHQRRQRRLVETGLSPDTPRPEAGCLLYLVLWLE